MTDKTSAAVHRGVSADLTGDGVTPPADIYETDSELVLVADLPGVGPEQLNIQVDKGVLTLEATPAVEMPGDDYAKTYVGFWPGTFFRAFALSDEIDRENIAAEVSNGVVTIHLPKAPSARSRKIEIKTR